MGVQSYVPVTMIAGQKYSQISGSDVNQSQNCLLVAVLQHLPFVCQSQSFVLTIKDVYVCKECDNALVKCDPTSR